MRLLRVSKSGHGPRGVCPECGECFTELDCYVGLGGLPNGGVYHPAEIIGAGIVIASGFLLVGNVKIALLFLVAGCIAASSLSRRRFLGAERIAFRSDGIIEYQDCRRVRQTRWNQVASLRVTFNGNLLIRKRGHLLPRSAFSGSKGAAEALRAHIQNLRRASIRE